MTKVEVTNRIRNMRIIWDLHKDGGFYSEVNGIKLHIYGAELSPITLVLTRMRDGGTRTIIEPSIPRLNFLLKKGDGEKQDLRKNLEAILRDAHDQLRERFSTPEKHAEYQEKIEQEFFNQLVFGDPHPFGK
ncbi:MAG: hypothetical protein HYT98_02010 [Candidatus Sungbacteria bacterium]|nr:hypothetical protein [Candidatus Sungbacteria bacterium]